MATSVVELLAERGIKLRSYRAGANEHLICPKCEGGRTREKSLSVTVDQDGSGATWVCHRGQCGWTDGARIGAEAPQRRQTTIRRPPTHTPAQTAHRPVWLYEYFAGRGIGARVVDKLGIYSVTRRFDAPIGETPTIVFPYVWRGEVVNRKYRPHPAKSPQMQERDAEHTLFNVDALGDKPDTIVWVEGEPDVMAVMECGINHVVSLKDGAPAKVSENGSEKRFEALRTHADVLTKAKRIILAGDMDQPGLALREELARRLGRHRCWLVTWPADCKDANDTLVKHGSTIVLAAIDAAEPYPIDGVQRIEQGTLAALRARPAPAVLTTGTRSSDQVLKLPTEGRLVIVTGFPNHGKAMALDTLIPTPDGWVTMGEIKDGDSVYAADGSVTRVLKAHPVLHGRECYRVTFADGAEFVCDADHLWFTHTRASLMSERHQKMKRGGRETTLPRGTDQRHLRKLPCAVTTRHIADTLMVPDGKKMRPNHSVAVAKPIAGAQEWPVDVMPYTLGAWLGDGSTENAALCSADEAIPEQIRKDGYEVRKGAPRLSWYIHGLKSQLRSSGVLGNKHIPAKCLRAAADDRLALLCGLMDTDGYLGSDGVAEFCTVIRSLADSVAELVCSLGMKAEIYGGSASINGKYCGPKYRVCFTPTMPVFRLERKLSRTPPRLARRPRTQRRSIVSVVPVQSVPVRCITVEHESCLYLVGKQFVPTHNTAWTRFVMIHTATNHDRRWLAFSPESQPWEQFAAECAEVFVGKPFYRGAAGLEAMTDDEVAHAETWLHDHITMLVCDAEGNPPTIDWVLERAAASVLRDGTTDLLIDPWNEIDHDRGQTSETDYTGRALQRLKAFALRHGCNVWIIAHPAKPLPTKPGERPAAPGPYSIAGSAHWANKTDVGITIHSPAQGETELHLWKSRFRRWGTRGAIAKMEYEQETGRFLTPIALATQPHADDEPPPDLWTRAS